MIKVVQFGEGNFLRTFVDLYFDTLNKEGKEYKVNIVKPITFGSLENFKKQNNKYHIVLRGAKNGKAVEDVYNVDVLENVVSPFEEMDKYLALAREDELKIIVSNTTEAGICYNGNDKFDDFEGITYPAKLTKFLLERFNAGKGGVYLMPVELIDNNADELKKCVDKYIALWNLPAEFKKWNDEQNFYCNTLVDRIVSGYPKTPEDVKYLENLLGESDKLVSIGEPFGLWAVEKKGNIADYVVVCKVKTATSKVWVEKLECEPVSYKDRLDYRMALDSDFTQAAGMNTLYLTFLKAVTQEDGSVKESVFHSGSVNIEIQRKDEYVFIPDKSLQAIDQMLLALDERMNKLDSMVEDVSELRANDIEIIDGEIFAGYKDPETGEFTPMGDSISAGSHLWEEM